MAEKSGAEPHGDIDLILEESFQAVYCNLVAIDLDLIQRRRRRDFDAGKGRPDLRLGDANVAMVVRVTGLVAEW